MAILDKENGRDSPFQRQYEKPGTNVKRLRPNASLRCAKKGSAKVKNTNSCAKVVCNLLKKDCE